MIELEQSHAFWYPPIYFRGPFRQFLARQPNDGLETVIRLVNFAAERWTENIEDVARRL